MRALYFFFLGNKACGLGRTVACCVPPKRLHVPQVVNPQFRGTSFVLKACFSYESDSILKTTSHNFINVFKGKIQEQVFPIWINISLNVELQNKALCVGGSKLYYYHLTLTSCYFYTYSFEEICLSLICSYLWDVSSICRKI